MPESVGQLKTDGRRIKQICLSWNVIFKNYYLLLRNKSFMLGSISLGLLTVPCLVWIALSPLILIQSAHLTVIGYALWQLPVFGACILGNIFLHYLTHFNNLKKLIIIGSVIVVISLIFGFILTYLFKGQYIWLFPGFIVYFFGLGVATAPLSRWILFVTRVSKGTASALMSMISLTIEALGIEVFNSIYVGQNNIHFSFYCMLSMFMYIALLVVTFKLPILQGALIMNVRGQTELSTFEFLTPYALL